MINWKYVFIWRGEFPKCAAIDKRGVIRGQSLFQDALTDPVKGHLWDLKKGKCLVHSYCKCSLSVYAYPSGLVSGHSPSTSYNDFDIIRKKVEDINQIDDDYLHGSKSARVELKETEWELKCKEIKKHGSNSH